MWHRCRVELYPHVGQLSGIRDKYGNELEFPSAFRLSRRNGERGPKGSRRRKAACRFESCRAYLRAIHVVHLLLGQREKKTLWSAHPFTGA